MKYTKIRAVDFPVFYKAFIKEPHICYLDVLPPEPGKVLVAKGLGNDLPESLPEECIVVDTRHKGGVILGFDDCIDLVAFGKEPPRWREQLTRYLRSRGLYAVNNGNDITVDGYKIAGYSARNLENGDLNYYVIHVSMNVDVDLIRKVCSKPMKKIPKGLSEWGITRQEVLTALEVE